MKKSIETIHRVEYIQSYIDDLNLANQSINELWINNEIGTNVAVMIEDFINAKLTKYNDKLAKEQAQ
jgi:hypothetical protein